ncbi:hypothetical protein Pla123a_36400 [Posidoniimonas polymericola]|uniref:Oligosaccharide repeat unit polymerase n=1 Tax=Posidoniimonas polymericola TaxID=2528002 RepID=A0A5C5YDD6_9BACT|nr:hypothetical protein [Posidoniimonas polymericola]TWT73747.1 hypothetical protein Pla123a_36400 [Posidoniimonas polymericola]
MFDDIMASFGFLFLLAIGLTIFVPFARGRNDLLTGWNFLLLGGALSTGFGSLEVAYGNFHWPELKWFHPDSDLKTRFVAYSLLFYGSLYFFYYACRPLTAWFAKGRLQKWPPINNVVLVSLTVVCILTSLFGLVVQNVPVLGVLLYNISHKAIVFGSVFSFLAWYRKKHLLPLLALFIGMYLFAGLYAMLVFNGRRLLLSVLFAPLAAMYWAKWRERGPMVTTGFCAVALATLLVGASVYSSFRHFSNKKGVERNVAVLVEKVKSVSVLDSLNSTAQDGLHYFGQYAGFYSMLTMELVDNDRISVEPLNSLEFVVGYPIPRLWWPSKPQPPGHLLLRTLRLPYKTTWGLGVVGESYYEGGGVVMVIYALLATIGIRFIDEPLKADPTNPFLIATLTAAFPHLMNWTRGSIAVMTVEVGECVFFALLLGFVSRAFWGTRTTLQAPAQAYPYASRAASAQ